MTHQPIRIDRIPPDTIVTFWQNVIVSEDPNGCWIWTGPKRGASEYGALKISTRQITGAHRASWIIHRGPIADGLHVLHKCDNPLCVNPDHLFLGTHQDNMRDRMAKGRTYRPLGQLHHRTKFTDADVLDIVQRIRDGQSLRSIADLYQVASPAIVYINSGRNWGHLTGATREKPIRKFGG